MQRAVNMGTLTTLEDITNNQNRGKAIVELHRDYKGRELLVRPTLTVTAQFFCRVRQVHVSFSSSRFSPGYDSIVLLPESYGRAHPHSKSERVKTMS